MDNKITFIGNMLEVNKIEVTIKQFADVIELGLIHPSLNDLYNDFALSSRLTFLSNSMGST